MTGGVVPAVVRRDSYTAAVYVGSLASAAVIGVYGALQPLLPTSASAWWLISALDLAVVAVCLGAAWAARRGLLDDVRRQDAALTLVLSAITAGVLIEALAVPVRVPYLAGNYLICLVAAGAVMRRWRSLLVYLAVAIGGWLLLHGLRDPVGLRWMPTLLIAGAVSCAVRGYVTTLYGLTRARELEARLTARIDALTGLPNRLGFHDQIRTLSGLARRREERLWLGFVDVNGFKSVNDTFGHATGDDLLVAVAAAVESSARDADAVARWGGDEFVIAGIGAAPGADLLEARIVEAVAPANPIGEHGWPIMVTIGIATTSPAPTLDEVENALREADLSMYRRRALR